ncbi:MAG: hypothetical protein M3540_09645, partial [Actinomycetota bacterium]|nr:hypothetical protein [Actinomycetota bacterium]
QQELGTLGRRRKRLRGTTSAEHKSRRESLGRTGTKPRHFLRHALKGAKEEMVDALRGQL